MIPEYIVLIRHGNHDCNGLSNTGRRQIASLSGQLKKHLKEAGHTDSASYALFSSTAERALQTAEIVGEMFGISCEERDFLYSSGGYLDDSLAEAALCLIKESDACVVILSTHYEFVNNFPSYIGGKLLERPMGEGELDKGSAWIIHTESATITRIIGIA